MTVFYVRGIVRTMMNHPKTGFSVLWRRGINEQWLEALLIDPRVHTDKGYKTNDADYESNIKYYRRARKIHRRNRP